MYNRLKSEFKKISVFIRKEKEELAYTVKYKIDSGENTILKSVFDIMDCVHRILVVTFIPNSKINF